MSKFDEVYKKHVKIVEDAEVSTPAPDAMVTGEPVAVATPEPEVETPEVKPEAEEKKEDKSKIVFNPAYTEILAYIGKEGDDNSITSALQRVAGLLSKDEKPEYYSKIKKELTKIHGAIANLVELVD
jgi:hypothetical protein